MRRYVTHSLKPLYRKVNSLLKQNEGFTLVELLVTLVVAAVLSGVLVSAFFNGTLGFRLTNETSELRSEADYLISSLLTEVNRSQFDAVRQTADETFEFYQLSEPNISSTGLIYRAAGYEPTDLTISTDSYTTSNANIVIEDLSITLSESTGDVRRPDFLTSGLLEIRLTLHLASNPTTSQTFESAIPF